VLSYYKFIMDAISPFFAVSKSSNFTPFLHLKGLQIEVKAAKQDVRKLVAIITSQVELEQLHILFICSSRKQRTPCTFDALFKAVEGLFHKPTFRCLIVENFHLTTATVLDILQEFLVSTACQDQQLTLKNLKIDSSSVRRSITYASASKVCRKSLSVEECSMTDEGIFSTADIASGILLHPGINSRMASVQTSGFLITWRGIPEVVKMGDPRADDLVRQKRFFLSQRVASQQLSFSKFLFCP